MFRGCCGGKRSTKNAGSGDALKSDAVLSPDIHSSSQPSIDIALPLGKKLNASVNDVRNNDNNTVLVQFQEDVAAADGPFVFTQSTIGTNSFVLVF